MHHIRPHQLFDLVHSPPAERIVQMQIPPRRADGSLTLLETCLLLSATRIAEAKRIFEFGTFLGSTTFNLALNTPSDGRVWTLDLDPECLGEVRQQPVDAQLTEIHLAAKRLDFVGSEVDEKITALVGNSLTFDFSEWQDSIDLVLIDGGHDLRTVQSDTESAFRILSKEKPACILWHDYGNREYPELTGYLEQLSREKPIFHIEDSMLCVYLAGRQCLRHEHSPVLNS
jgi:hypothetical protein